MTGGWWGLGAPGHGRAPADATAGPVPTEGGVADPVVAGGGAPPTGPSPLEVRYRRWLRLLPRAYRAAREPEMVDTFLERAYGDDPENADLTAKYGSVGWGEAMSVLALALRLRWADPQGPPRLRVRAEALPLAALGCLTVLAVGAAVWVCSRLWLLAFPPADLAGSPVDLAFGTAPGIWPFVLAWSFVLWIPAFALAVSGRRSATTVAAWVAAVPAVVTLVEAFRQPGVGLLGAFDWALAVVQGSVVTALAVMAGTARNGGPFRRRYLTAALAGIAAYELITVVAVLGPPAAVPAPLLVIFFGSSGGPTGFWFVATLSAAVVLAGRRARGAPPTASALLALTAVAAATTLLLLTGFPAAWQMFVDGDPPWASPFVAAVIQLALAAAITVTAGILAARRIRRLPAVRY